MVQHGTTWVQHGTTWYNMAQRGATWYGTTCYNLVQLGTTWYTMVQLGTTWYNQCTAALSVVNTQHVRHLQPVDVRHDDDGDQVAGEGSCGARGRDQGRPRGGWCAVLVVIGSGNGHSHLLRRIAIHRENMSFAARLITVVQCMVHQSPVTRASSTDPINQNVQLTRENPGVPGLTGNCCGRCTAITPDGCRLQ
jgi:hypothetical protein